jgi:hypothetical protein
MNSALEFHDSEVSTVEASVGSVRILFSAAYVHRSEGTPGVDNGDGYVQEVEIQIANAAWKGTPEEWVGKISDGDLFIKGTRLDLVPLPFEATDDVRLELQFTNGATLWASGTSVRVRHLGEARFVERFTC